MLRLLQPDPEALRAEIRRCRTMTDKPFGVKPLTSAIHALSLLRSQVNLTILPALIPADYDSFAKVSPSCISTSTARMANLLVDAKWCFHH